MGDQYESGVRRLWGADAAMTDVDMQLFAVLADLAHRHGLALAALEHDYAGEHFVTVLPEGSAPATGQVAGANTIRIGAAVDARSGQATVISAIDNLVKGTAGAALQSMNLALGLPETTGLPTTGVAP